MGKRSERGVRTRFESDVGDLIRVFAIDPGETSGWAVVRARVGDGGVGVRVESWGADEVRMGVAGIEEWGGGVDGFWREKASRSSGVTAQAMILLGLIERFDPDVLVLEDFILDVGRASGKRGLLSPVQVIAMLEMGIVWRGLEMVVVRQSPSDAKTAIPDRRLKSAGMWSVGSAHARDATRHALLYLRRSSNRGLGTARR